MKINKKSKSFRLFWQSAYLINKAFMIALIVFSMFMIFWLFLYGYQEMPEANDQIYPGIGYSLINNSSALSDWYLLRNLGLLIFISIGIISNAIIIPLKKINGRPLWGVLSVIAWMIGLFFLTFGHPIAGFILDLITLSRNFVLVV